MLSGIKFSEEIMNHIHKNIQICKDYYSDKKEIYYIRDRDTLIKHTCIEKVGEEFTVYSITSDRLPAAFFKYPCLQDVIYTERFNTWLDNKIYAERDPYCYDHMAYAHTPFYNKRIIFKGYSGRSNTDNYEIVDENDNFTFYREDWVKDSVEYMEKVTKRILNGEPIDQEVYNKACRGV